MVRRFTVWQNDVRLVIEGGVPVAVQFRGKLAAGALSGGTAHAFLGQGARENLTDRARRYRAQRTPPPGRRRCAFCGSRRNVEIGHLDGHEEHGEQNNLIWTCRACNVQVANVMRRAGLGRRTRQYNPAGRGRSAGSKTAQLKAYGDAIKVMRGVFPGDVKAAMRTIRATPPSVRSAFNFRTWPVRREKYGPSGRQGGLFDEVPF